MTEKERKDQLKQELHRYRDLEAERKQLALELEKIEDIMAAPKGTNWDGMPRASGVGDPVLGVVTQHLALQERYRKKVGELAAAQAAIEDRIEALEPRARKLMRHRYIEGLSWEEVCVAMCYSWRQTHNIHGAALDAMLAAEDEALGRELCNGCNGERCDSCDFML
jgi:DNA-directed RNA polymerase specialized sigma24 family protein